MYKMVSALTKLDLKFCQLLPEGVSFTLTSPRKRGSPKDDAKAFFAQFPSNTNLCPKSTFEHFLQRTKELRLKLDSSQQDILFLSYVKPHKPISTASLSRWLRACINNAGIDTAIFKAHSVRGASTTAAANNNVPLKEILQMADWSNPNTFQKYYYKPLFQTIYGQVVLSTCQT